MSGEFLSIKEAADLLGVSRLTLRNWDKQGKLSARRHPINNYRVYKKDELEAIVKQIGSGRPSVLTDKNKKRKLTVIHLND